MYEETERIEQDGDRELYKYGWGCSFSFFYSSGGGGGASFYGGTNASMILMLTSILLVLALIFLGLFLISNLFKLFNKIDSTKIIKTFGILALIFCILTPIIFMIALPGALKADAKEYAENRGDTYEEPDHDHPTKSFFGSFEEVEEDSYSTEIDRASWGGDIGWFLAIISFVFVLLAFIMALRVDGEAEKKMDYQEAQYYQTPVQPSIIPPAQPPQQPLQPPSPPTQVTCPGCKQVFQVNVASYPAPIKCPYCGTSGILE